MRFVQIFRNFLDEQAEVIRWQFLQLIRLKTFEELIVAILPGFFEFLVSFESVQVIGHGTVSRRNLILYESIFQIWWSVKAYAFS